MDVKKFDIFPKLANEYRLGTTHGGVLSILSLILTIYLSTYEIRSFLNPPIRQRLFVDTRRPTGPDNYTISLEHQSKLDVSVDVTLFKLPCYLLHFDVIDPVSQLLISKKDINAVFTRLDSKGNPLGLFEFDKVFEKQKVDGCGPCYGALSTEASCCNTCADIYNFTKNRYLGGIPYIGSVEQCKYLVDEFKQMEGEGCHVKADFRSHKVASEFHISPGYPLNVEGWHIHSHGIFDIRDDEFNFSHSLNKLHFTKSNSKMPLDNYMNIQTSPGRYRAVYTADILENSYTASRYVLYNFSSEHYTGLIFRYDVSPITAISYLDNEPLIHLCTRLLTIVGGVLGILRAVDFALFHFKYGVRPNALPS